MKRFLILMSLVMVTMMMQAVPAKRGIWKTLTLENGTEVRAQLVGDERAHFWLTEDGQRYELQGDVLSLSVKRRYRLVP